MSSNGDPVANVVVAEDTTVVVALDDNDGNMQAAVHFVAKSKRKRQKHQFSWEYVKDWQDSDSTKHCGKRQCTRKYENDVVDYVVESGVTLRAVGDVRFKKFVVSLTNGYEPSSIRTILRRIVKLYRILEPLLTAFLCNLDVAISLMLDSWSNRNLKGFYVVTAH
ncbi:unnamed protein product [Sphagnum troendelagicum]